MMDRERRNAVRRFVLAVFAKAIGAQVRWFRRLAGDGDMPAEPWSIEIRPAGHVPPEPQAKAD